MTSASSAASDPSASFKVCDLFQVKGKVALVTGGGTGIGKMMSLALVQNGAKVYIASRKLAVVQETADELNRIGPGTCIPLQADLTNRSQAAALANQIKQREDKLNILINNAGMSWGSALLDFDEKNGWDRLFALNVKSLFYLTTECVPLLEKAANGNKDPARVINISSVAGSSAVAETPLAGPNSGTWSYAASKAAVNQLTRTLASTLSQYFITVNAIAPGVFPSRMTKYGIDNSLDVMEASQPLGRIGVPGDIAGTALYLCSKASAHLTGVVIPLDGGQTLSLTAMARL